MERRGVACAWHVVTLGGGAAVTSLPASLAEDAEDVEEEVDDVQVQLDRRHQVILRGDLRQAPSSSSPTQHSCQ